MRKNFYVLAIIFAVLVIPIPVFAQEMKFYENEKYDFSLEIPSNWQFQEDVVIDEKNTEEVFLFPEQFSIQNSDKLSPEDTLSYLMGWEFQFAAPLIGVDYRTLSTTEVTTLNENDLLEFYLKETLDLDPTTKIIESYSKTHSYGWEIGIISTLELESENSKEYIHDEKLFIFKDRDVYGVAYGASDIYFDDYKPVFDHVLDTANIKSITVSQNFQEIEPEIQIIENESEEKHEFPLDGAHEKQSNELSCTELEDCRGKCGNGTFYHESTNSCELYPVTMTAEQYHELKKSAERFSLPSPLKQFKIFDIAPNDILCKTGFDLIVKSDGSPACVKPSTAEKLIERGWTNTR